jgi:hopanoid biosynthesis associated protein HpnK
MVSGRAFEEAVTLAKDNPTLAVGLHVTTVNGWPVLPPSEIPDVVEKNGAFLSDPAMAGLKYFFCRSARQELSREIAAQFEKFSRSGLNFSHVDSHCHMHMHPVVLDAIIENSIRYGIRKVRVPADRLESALPFLMSPFASAGYALLFKILTERLKRKLRTEGFVFPNRVYGNLLTGKMSLEYVLSLVENLPTGVSEIYFHPAMHRSTGQAIEAGQLQQLRELLILIDVDLRSRIDLLGIALSTYFDLE